MKSSNPVLNSWVAGAGRGQTMAPPYAGYGAPGYAYPNVQYPPMAPPRVTTMTLDDVVIRTVGLLALLGISGAAAWILIPETNALNLALFGSMITGLVLGLVISFARITNPVVIGAYAVAEGVFLGIVSKFYETLFNGIVLQAVVGTFAVFAGMAVLYKFRVLRATPLFTKVVLGALIGAVGLMLVNLLFAVFGADLGIFGNPTDGQTELLPILVSLALVVIAALTFVLDFAAVEEGVRAGAPQKYAWYASFGIVVGLVFLYLQLLRLLSLLRE